MEEGLSGISAGVSVDIKRTDGRIHTAVVSGINYETRSVTVEWFERGETKGKEIEIEALLSLNPDLLPKGNSNQNVIPTKVTRYAAKSGNIGAAGNKVDDGNRSTYYQRTRQQQARPTDIIPALNGHGEQQNIASARGVENTIPTPSTPTVTSLAAKQQQLQQQLQQQQQQQQAAIAAAQGGMGRGRRSNVVKEVERLKKNREERRQRQAELKEEKEVLMSMDPGNPNWEFLAMIREYRNSIEFRPLRESDPVEDHQITVCIRKRPLNKKGKSG